MQRGSLKSIKLRGVKVWRAQWREDGRGRTRILGTCSAVTRGDAQLQLDAIVTRVNGRPAPPRAIDTLQQYIDHEYLVQRSRIWKASTAGTTEQLIRLYILPDLGARPIATLTRRELQGHLDKLAGAGRSGSVVKNVRFQLQAIFALAMGDGLVRHNPTEGLVNPRFKKESDQRVVTLGDVQRALCVLEIRERLIFHLAVYQGMRPGEIVGLRLGDISGDIIHVRRRVYEGKVDTPKSRRGDRQIPVIQRTRALLDTYIEMLCVTGADAWLFPSETGITPVAYANAWADRIRPALQRIGLGHVNFQILRRTWVTEFANVETDAHVCAQLAGHGVNVNQNQYRQGKVERLRESMSKWSDSLQ